MAPRVGTKEVEEKQGCGTPPGGDRGERGCVNALKAMMGGLPPREQWGEVERYFWVTGW